MMREITEITSERLELMERQVRAVHRLWLVVFAMVMVFSAAFYVLRPHLQMAKASRSPRVRGSRVAPPVTTAQRPAPSPTIS
jgi:hypothetical protein